MNDRRSSGEGLPLISVIIPTYNRAQTVLRAIRSVQQQTVEDWEIVVVDDGSTDNTREILRDLHDPRIRIVCHERNRGVNAAKNTGFDQMRGTWFTILDSDDEILGEDALETMLSVPARIDPAINAVTCNCMDSSTGSLTGSGMDDSGYLEWKTILAKCSGEFWGITRASLLGSDRLNPEQRGLEDVLWHKVDKKAVRYYLHRPLRVWHTDGLDRLGKEKNDDPVKKKSIYSSFVALLGEREYLQDLRIYAPDHYFRVLFNAGITFIRNQDRARTWRIFRHFFVCNRSVTETMFLFLGSVGGQQVLDLAKRFKGTLHL